MWPDDCFDCQESFAPPSEVEETTEMPTSVGQEGGTPQGKKKKKNKKKKKSSGY